MDRSDTFRKIAALFLAGHEQGVPILSEFCPDGYVPVREAIAQAAVSWFAERCATFETGFLASQATKAEPDNSFEAVARALSQPSIPDDLRQELVDILTKTVDILTKTIDRLRNHLHQGRQLKAYYFEPVSTQAVPSSFWASKQADGALESGTYWPFGQPHHPYDKLPSYPMLLRQSELDAVLTEQQPAKKRPFPEAKKPDLAAALRNFDHLPNRKAQHEALRASPEFRGYRITDKIFREAAKKVPREPGRKRH
jgi:hypothetical protein